MPSENWAGPYTNYIEELQQEFIGNWSHNLYSGILGSNFSSSSGYLPMIDYEDNYWNPNYLKLLSFKDQGFISKETLEEEYMTSYSYPLEENLICEECSHI